MTGLKILSTEAIGGGIEKVRMATKLARGIDLNTGLLTTIVTETKVMFMHHNKVFNLRTQRFCFETAAEAREQLNFINQLYDICKTANTAVLYFNNKNTQTTVCINYTENHCHKSAMVTYDFLTGKIVKITPTSGTAFGLQGDTPYRRLTINPQQTPNKRRLTIADALSRRA